jgi:hypothetical protein
MSERIVQLTRNISFLNYVRNDSFKVEHAVEKGWLMPLNQIFCIHCSAFFTGIV